MRKKRFDSEPKATIADNAMDLATSVSPPVASTVQVAAEMPVKTPDIRLTTSGANLKSDKFKIVQLGLIAGIICSTAFLFYSLLGASPRQKVPEPVSAETKNGENKTTEIAGLYVSATEEESKEPLSLQLAENYYDAKDYDRAYDVYRRLINSIAGPDFELARDFLLLEMGLCLERKGEADRANQIFKKAAMSRSIVTAAFANYHSSLMELRLGQYLNARTRAYKTIALTGAFASEYDWVATLEQDCAFLIAEAVTRQVLMLCDADSELPQNLLTKTSENDQPYPAVATALTELIGLKSCSLEELQQKLSIGTDKLNKGLLTPQIKAIDDVDISSAMVAGEGHKTVNKSNDFVPTQPGRWQVCCSGPGIDEFLVRFAARASLDVKWLHFESDDVKSKSSSQEPKWNRSLTLYLPSATAQQVVTTAAGAVGLLAQLEEPVFPEDESPQLPAVKGTITISDPASYLSLSQHTRMLAEHAMWLWRKALLIYADDRRASNAHFALGVLEEKSGRIAEAITEFKLVSTRYSKTSLAPFALMRSSRLKTSLRDYGSAARDLKELIEQYPDSELVSQAYLDLAQTTMKTGQLEQACSLYRKAFNQGFSAQLTASAALGAGMCYYQLKDYESAKKWLIRHIEMVGAQKADNKLPGESSDTYHAFFLLGKTYLALGNPEAACSALYKTTKLAAAGNDYFEALLMLVEAQIDQNNFIDALSVIEAGRDRPLSQEQSTRLLILKSKALRSMGLANQAMSLLSDSERYITDSRLKTAIIIEIARCAVSEGNFDLAKHRFTEALTLLEAGPEARNVSLELAEVCLKLGENQQAIAMCSRLLDSLKISDMRQAEYEIIKQKASVILASAYKKQNDYDKAAQVILMASK